ncbi:hypothetical protein HanRHA438_Chr13g0610561 [Helianthus annuus]|nr:hypothetical protein HanRHA438_Chr13g0610561 [Helianthus annuus]
MDAKNVCADATTVASEDSGSLTNCGYDDGTVRDVTRRAYSSRT